ncbi:hypothetical protein HJFPF1_04447 [Paramyrothecium foliicola]|nr:hypothetical protein HJFPF1_04447 [Paramyrothecium foliicola]
MANFAGVVFTGESDLSQPTPEEILECPWKYRGYKDFSSFVAADPDFFAVRRFGRLHTRALLTLQDHLTELEEKLDALDEQYSRKSTKILGSNPPVVITAPLMTKEQLEAATGSSGPQPDISRARDINNGTVRDDMPERVKILSEIVSKLAEYDRLLLDHTALRNMTTAPERNSRNIKAWFAHNTGAIMEEETQFVNHLDDLVTGYNPKPKLRAYFEDHILLRTEFIRQFFKKAEPSNLSSHDEVKLFSDQVMDVTGSLAVFLAALLMLVAPLWILQAMKDIRSKLTVITSFVVAFLLFLSLGTLGRPFERLAATAGYAAVLVVFLQLGASPS